MVNPKKLSLLTIKPFRQILFRSIESSQSKIYGQFSRNWWFSSIAFQQKKKKICEFPAKTNFIMITISSRVYYNRMPWKWQILLSFSKLGFNGTIQSTNVYNEYLLFCTKLVIYLWVDHINKKKMKNMTNSETRCNT